MRVVDEGGAMMKDPLPTYKALAMASEKGLDLVEVGPHAKPPTCKIMDYGKWKFKQSKKEKISRKNQIKIVVKEIQLRPRTDVHDLQIKMKKAREFLQAGLKVKVHLRYSGREMAHKELGLQMLERVKQELASLSVLDQEAPQMEKRSAFLFFSPDGARGKAQQKQSKKTGGPKTDQGRGPQKPATPPHQPLTHKPLLKVKEA